ncbi:MAG: SoxR reducing system RseC family protein [Gammaproteobacteria bacterium]|nr:SoxR reducing system RseC family protein [Gammaproteobacteria bacterium]
MIEERVEVIRVQRGRAWVRPVAGSGCARCDAGTGCGAGLWQRAFGLRQRQIVLPDDGRFKEGDQLLLGITEGALLGSAAMLYLLPLVTLIAGAAVGTRMATAGAPVWSVAVSALAGLAAGLLVARCWAKRGEKSLTPGITRMIPVVTKQDVTPR